MNKLGILGIAAIAAVAVPSLASAKTIGVAMASLDAYKTLLANGIKSRGESLGLTVRVENADKDSDRQIAALKDFVKSGVDAIIVNPVNGDRGVEISKIATDAGIPLIYVNSEPINVDRLPPKQAFVASKEAEAGTLEAKQVCQDLGGKGKVAVMMGELLHPAARRRTEYTLKTLQSDGCKGIQVIEQQSANWSRDEGAELMREWLAAGERPDAIISNNDEMALGAIRSLKEAGIDMSRVKVAGVDATKDALAAMKRGDMAVTVFQNAAGQASAAVDAAMKFAGGEDVPSKIYVPFELVTPANVAQYAGKN
ncbi:substrate-binding domain-containing protein [Jiella sp. M17.18]|uniref:substrate-binding domain-containing protein n=1 Tax=Jiella sp. M17.18 TaxID=3234247 RepID=UPI0034DE4BCD